VSQYLPRLVIYVVWHPAFERGRQMAERIYAHFSRDPERPNARGLGIPVFFRSATTANDQAPPPISIASARHTAVIALVDAEMMTGGPAWKSYVTQLWDEASAQPEQHRLFPVAFTKGAYNLSQAISEANFIRLQNEAPETAPARLLNRLTNDLARLLTQRPRVASLEAQAEPSASPTKIRLFLSHAKLDGEKTALALRNYVHDNLALDTFFDAIDIAAGFRIKDEIDRGIDEATIAVVLTDAYASRVWCQHEIIRAKRHGRPVVVIHAIEEGEARSFPYIGNVPTIRWRTSEPGRIEAVIGLVLREVLRAEYFQQHFEDLRALFRVPEAVRALPRAPELLTCLALRAETEKVPYFVYPDPPLAAQEIELLSELDPNLRLTTPTFLFADPTQPAAMPGEFLAKALAESRVGISISNSPDLALRGFGLPKLANEKEAPLSAHLRDAMGEFARFLLAAGTTLAYGGDLRGGGFTEVLFELVAAYRSMSGEQTPPVQSYLAWPLYLDLSKEQESDWSGLVEFHRIPAPADLGLDPAVKIAPRTPENRMAWARSLTAMRQRMNVEIHARLLMGGQTRGLGKYPGLVEEALLAMRARKPVYLIGAFGGAAEAIIEAIHGSKPAALTFDYQAADPAARAAIDLYNAKIPPGEESIDYHALTTEFETAGIAGLNNGLDADDNERLFTTTHLPEMVALVLRGLGRLGKPPA
jgi:SLOG cluster2/TIR domain